MMAGGAVGTEGVIIRFVCWLGAAHRGSQQGHWSTLFPFYSLFLIAFLTFYLESRSFPPFCSLPMDASGGSFFRPISPHSRPLYPSCFLYASPTPFTVRGSNIINVYRDRVSVAMAWVNTHNHSLLTVSADR